jgi:hypothetical protein
MKINIEIDCSPDEARRFLGFPEIAPLQERVMEELETRLVDALSEADPQKLVESWMPFGPKGMEQWQNVWGQLMTTAAGMQPSAPKEPET